MNIIKKGSKKLFIIILIVLISILFCQFSGFADQLEKPLFSLFQDGPEGFFDTTVEAGESGTITFTVKNAAEEERTNAIFIYDALTNTNGGNKIMSPGNFTKDYIAKWFDSEPEIITLAAGEMLIKEVEFTVPIDTPPGNYCAIMAMYNAKADDPVEQMNEEENVGITINQAITQTTAIVVRVPGDYERTMTLDEGFNHGYGPIKGNLLLSVPFTNESTAYDFPTFNITIFDSSNVVRFQLTRQLPIVYAQTSSDILFDASSAALEAGTYTVNVVMTYGDDPEKYRDEKTYILDLSVEDVQEAVLAEEKHELRTADDLDLQGFFVFDKDKIVMYIIIGGGVLLFIILLILLLMRRPKGRRGKTRKNKKNINNEDVSNVKTRKRGNHSEE